MRRSVLVLASYAAAAAVLTGCALVSGSLLLSGALRSALDLTPRLARPRSTIGHRPGLARGVGIHRQHNRRETPWI